MIMNKETFEQVITGYAASAKPSFVTGEFDRYAIAQAFEEGAQWRINSVWHDAETETPRDNEPIIGITGKICCYMGLCGETAKEICPEMKKWAYISDLIPERKEAAL